MRVPYTQAISFAVDHNAFAALTRDGLLTSRTTFVPVDYHGEALHAELDDDIVFVESRVFDVDDLGRVDSGAVRAFLGY